LVLAAIAFVQSKAISLKSRGVDVKKGDGYRQVLHNFQNMQYYADFDVGGQEIAGIFDTGSFELLIRSTRCDHCAHPTPPYNHLLSKSYEANGTVTKHVFGSGPCVSVMGYDTVSVGPDLHAKGQAFWEILDHRIPVLDTAKFAAIVGIGPNFAYGNKEQTLLMSFGIDEFSVCLQKAGGSEGYLTWGPEKTDLKKSDYATARVHGKHHWAAKLENVYFPHETQTNETVLPCGAGQECSAIIDSGTSLIAAPTAALAQLSMMIPPIQEDCSNLHELPVLRFMIDGNPLELPPQAYVMRVTGAALEANDVWDILFFKPKIRKLNMCMPAFMQIDMQSDHGPVWILGMPFFRYYHTTFDRKNEVMRFSVAGPDCESRAWKPAANKTESMLAVHSEVGSVLDVDLKALVPPSLSEMMDYKGEKIYKFGTGQSEE
jgi:hypothetical protein